MSGMFFENPGVRFSRRLSLFHFRMRFVASRLFRRVTGADSRCSRMDSRYDEAEFPATQTAHELFFLGSRARDRASTDALRPFNNWVKPEDQYGISIIGEKWPAFARRLPQKGRQSPALPERAQPGAGEEIILGENHGALYRWKTGDKADGADARQRLRALAFAAQT